MRDVIVVGAGPGGSSAAAFLARAGRDVLLLDKAKFPRDKPCGDAQGPNSRDILKELGVYEAMMKAPACEKIYGLEFASPGGDILQVLKTEVRGFCTPRKIFDNMVKDAAVKSGAELMEEFRVTDLLFEDGKVCGVSGVHQGEPISVHSKLVIGADGAYTIVGRKLGLFPQDPKHYCYSIRTYYENAKGMEGKIGIYADKYISPGYSWIFSLGNGMVNVGSGMLAAAYAKSDKTLEELLNIFITRNKFAQERLGDAKEVGTFKGWRQPMGGQATKNYAPGVLLVGDAASFINPITGEGIGEALKSGKMAAEVCGKALEKNDFSEETLRDYERKWRASFAGNFRYALLLQKIFRHPWIINRAVKSALRDRKVKKAVAGIISGSIPKRALFSPGIILRLLRPF